MYNITKKFELDKVFILFADTKAIFIIILFKSCAKNINFGDTFWDLFCLKNPPKIAPIASTKLPITSDLLKLESSSTPR